MTANLQCPDSEKLIDFSRGGLSDQRLAQIANHLETCEECETAMLEAEHSPDQFMKAIQRIAKTPAGCSDELTQRIEQTLEVILGHFRGRISDDFGKSSVGL